MKPNIVLLATGGTIAGAGGTGRRTAYQPARLGVDALLAAVPQIAELATIRGEQLVSIGSQDMSDEVWLRMAEHINVLLASADVGGLVVTHGTDTLEETAYFLNLVVRSDKPLVMTAAMRPATALSADGPLNVFNAVAVAADPEAGGRGVLVVVNDDILGARGITKTSTTDVQAFVSAERGLMGATLYGENRYFRRPYRRHTSSSEFSVEGVAALPRVDVIYISAGFSPDLIDSAVANGVRGLVIAGVGNGNMNQAALAAVGRAVRAGVAVVRSTRVASGLVGRNLEIDDDRLGTVASGELNPAQSRVLLKLALMHTADPGRIQGFFDSY